MIYIYTRNKLQELKGDREYIQDARAYFDVYHTELNWKDPEVLDIVKTIDNAEILYYDNLLFKTPFGIAHSFDLSSGCKTVLAYLHLAITGLCEEYVLNINKCGPNGIDILFKLADKYNLNSYFMLNYTPILSLDLHRVYNINNKIYDDICYLDIAKGGRINDDLL